MIVELTRDFFGIRIGLERCFSARGLHRALSGLAQIVRQMTRPKRGDRILVVRPQWIGLILSGEKTLEIRSRNLSLGKYWLGMKGKIYGRIQLEAGTLIASVQAWTELRFRHKESPCIGPIVLA